jgi:hypothetical protein
MQRLDKLALLKFGERPVKSNNEMLKKYVICESKNTMADKQTL